MSDVLLKHHTLYIGGEWTDGDRDVIQVVNPATEQIIAEVPSASIADADAAVEAAARLHEAGTWARATFRDRADVLDRIADALEARSADLLRVYVDDLGGPTSLAAFVNGLSVQVFRHTAEIARTLEDTPETRHGSGAPVVLRKVPVGPVLASVPWNAPLLLLAVKASAALAAGCPVICRADEQAPLASFCFAEAVASLDLPAGLVSVLPAGVEVSKHLVSHPGVRHISFTGSTAVGKEVMRAAAQHLTRVTLELGGKSAAIVLDDLDPSAVSSLYLGCLAQTGQICTTYSRVLVPESQLNEWTVALTEFFTSLPIGDPWDPQTMVGPLASGKQRATVERYVDIAREEGTVVAGGRRPAQLDHGFYYEPTLVTGVARDSRIAQEEVFGPVVVIMGYKDVDDAVQIANGTDYGLAAGIFTNDLARAELLAPRLRAGAVSINNFGANMQECFGGLGASGFGREGGREGIEELLEVTQLQYPAQF